MGLAGSDGRVARCSTPNTLNSNSSVSAVAGIKRERNSGQVLTLLLLLSVFGVEHLATRPSLPANPIGSSSLAIAASAVEISGQLSCDLGRRLSPLNQERLSLNRDLAGAQAFLSPACLKTYKALASPLARNRCPLPGVLMGILVMKNVIPRCAQLLLPAILMLSTFAARSE